MTISYGDNFGILLLTRWRGSIWKSVWKELVIWMTLYYAVRVIYRHMLDDVQQQSFEDIAIMFDTYSKTQYITFVLGFYIGKIVERWWEQFQRVPWTDRYRRPYRFLQLMSTVCYIFDEDSEEHELLRHTIARYLNLASVLAWRKISPGMSKLFPSVETAVQCGLMTEYELQIYYGVQSESNRWQVPIRWIQGLVQQRRRHLNLPAPIERDFLVELNKFREGFHELFCYDWVCIPMVYTNVATLSTYAFFIFCLISRQFLLPEKQYDCCKIDFYVPIFTVTQFLFFVGWCKVGQDLMRPFGSDDDDIDVLSIFRRNLRTSFHMAHSLHTPQPCKDQLWQTIFHRAGSDGSIVANGSATTSLDAARLTTDVTAHMFHKIGRPTAQFGDLMF